MYFHSSSYRHEQYAALRSAATRSVDTNKKDNNNTNTNDKGKRSSLSSNTSGADSGYTSSTSSSPNATQPSPISLRVAAEETTTQQQSSSPTTSSPSSSSSVDSNNNSHCNNNNINNNTNTHHHQHHHDTSGTSIPKKPKKKSSRTKNQLQQQQRQPDLVYSCPRPLAFPFHNDAHFLPVAEADPRDVARVAPPNASSRRQSAASSKASSLASTSQFDQHSAYRYHRSLRSKTSSIHSSTRQSTDDFTDTETLRSQRTTSSSIMSSMHRGTVRSLRSLFQIPTPHHPPSSMPPAVSSASTFSATPRSSSVSSNARPEIRRGTVQSIREIFTSSPPLDATTSNNLAIAERNAKVNSKTSRILGRLSPMHRHNKDNNKKDQPIPVQQPAKVTTRSRASSVASNATTLCNKPLPKSPHRKDLDSSSVKNMDQLLANAPSVPSKPPSTSAFANFKRMFTREKKKSPALSSSTPSPPPLKSSNTASTLVSPELNITRKPVPTTLSSPSPPVQPPKPTRRSLFATWLRPDPSPKKTSSTTTSSNKKKSSTTTTTSSSTTAGSSTASNDQSKNKAVEEEEQEPPTVVGRLWKSFKRMVTGKKSSRVGVL
ncbi:hypothetical protein BDA99DRAFT_519722 [Phascolomyces articulosus]|uniref:Uncharacterized protein n=1 Tax=Phascolomyces articulosus TaxID=60185 RepID=A0AAD5JT72_9FUNG|nr:hypothetical protein BDA99DRAFT_519722 [Phascolomyces articulosus]